MERVTVGVITMYRKNYGAFLQAYALQKKLLQIGYAPELIRYDYYTDHSMKEKDYGKRKGIIKNIKRSLINIVRFSERKKRDKVFLHSIEKNLIESSKLFRTYQEMKECPPEYDIYLTGSDQVFNPKLTPHANASRRLDFAKGIKVSYAASAGNIDFDIDSLSELANSLCSFSRVSVREKALKDFLELQGITCEQHIDPTLLLDRNEWNEFKKTPVLPTKYILYYQVGSDKRVYEAAQKMSAKLGLPVYTADGFKKFNNQIPRKGYLSPEEWVGAIYNAEYVVTNSFHGTVFAILFKKKALIVKPQNRAERIVDLIKNCHLERLYIDEVISDDMLKDLYSRSDEYLSLERQKTDQYLKQLADLDPVSKETENERKNQVKINPFGFDYSSLKAYSGYYKEDLLVKESSSGGAATAISKGIIEAGGVVFGVAWLEGYKSAGYICAEHVDDLSKLKGSIYIETSKKVQYNGRQMSVYEMVREKLEDGRIVLFIGLGCDVATIKAYLSNHNIDMSKLYTIDLVCHGPTYSIVADQYVKHLEEKYKSGVSEFSLRYKKRGWVPPYIRAKFMNGEVFTQPFYDTDFGFAFNNYTRKACFACTQKGAEHKSDLTLGDYHGVDKFSDSYNRNGVSLIIQNSERGEQLLKFINEEEFKLQEADLFSALTHNKYYYKRREESWSWAKFDQNIRKFGLHKAVIIQQGRKKYLYTKLKHQIKYFVKE
jgi:coenzyme F420-reducing hydrogenase beta subunit